VFCPNCGTQNSETASTCIKCGFNLKGAAAPKFKGTMLMTNQPGGAPRPARRPLRVRRLALRVQRRPLLPSSRRARKGLPAR
jgi:uncharacterized membrane protein YvbJ